MDEPVAPVYCQTRRESRKDQMFRQRKTFEKQAEGLDQTICRDDCEETKKKFCPSDETNSIK